MALEITDATFEEVVLKSDKPVMVDFWAAWCGPCRMVGPIIDEISQDFDGKAVVGKVDVDANQEFAAKYGVRNIPTVLVFDKGELVGRHVGVSPKDCLCRGVRCCNLIKYSVFHFLFVGICLANTKWSVYLHTLIKVW